MNKRGWIRIMEATISILLVSSVLLVVYSRQVDSVDLTDTIYVLEKSILSDISLREDLRLRALKDDTDYLNDFAGDRIPSAFNYTLKICDLGNVCKILDADLVRETKDKDVYSEEIIISSELGTEGDYDPKKVKLFIWEVS